MYVACKGDGMSIRQMEYMLALAEHKSISLAAESCFISQSALSQSLATLEKTLNVRLFSRTHNIWTPTEAGNLYLKHAGLIVAAHNRMLFEIGTVQTNAATIRLGMSFERGSMLFSRIYLHFANAYPDVALQLVEEHYLHLQQMLIRGEIDLALSVIPGAGQEESRLLRRVGRMVREELVLIVPHDHAFAIRYRKNMEDTPEFAELFREKFISHPKNKALRRILDAKFAEFSPKKHMEVKSTTSVIEFVSQGIGIAVVPKLFTHNIDAVCAMPLRQPEFWELGVLCKRVKQLSREEEGLVDIIIETLRNADMMEE